MGLNLSVYRADGTEWEKWDFGKYSGDREFAACDLAVTTTPLVEDYGVVIERGFRPVDFAAWRERFVGEDHVNSDRFEALLDFLERNPGSYVHAGW